MQWVLLWRVQFTIFVQREPFPVKTQAQWEDGCNCEIRGMFEIKRKASRKLPQLVMSPLGALLDTTGLLT